MTQNYLNQNKGKKQEINASVPLELRLMCFKYWTESFKVCSKKSYNYYLIFIRSERKKFAQRRWATVKRKERGGVGAFPTSYPSPLLLILNQARVGRIDDREFVTLTQTYGDRAFSVAAPKLWNELPLDLRSLDTINLLKKHLKTDLFKKAYNI